MSDQAAGKRRVDDEAVLALIASIARLVSVLAEPVVRQGAIETPNGVHHVTTAGMRGMRG